MESNNSFSKGQSSDMSKLFNNPDTYLKALNFRAVTDLGQSNGGLVNIKGTNCEITFPQIRGIYKLIINRQYDGSGNILPGIVNITINSNTTINIAINQSTKITDIVSVITLLNNCYNNPNSVVPDFAVAYNSTEIFIYQQPEYKTCNSIASIEPNISITQVSGSSTVLFVDSNNNTSNTAFPFYNALNDTIIVIGSTFINETIYLYTTGFFNSDNLGQIWEMSYNEITKQTTIKLIYNGNLNFTTAFPIAPSATTGRYELDSLQRIYWTDFNNPVRSINVKDPNLMTLLADLINLKPSVQMSIPILETIIDGSAVAPLNTAATYQMAYRLTKNNGAVTNYSVASNIVYVTPGNIGQYNALLPNYCSLVGDNTTINKAIRWKINNIDISYDNIEYVIIERFYPNEDVFNIYKFDTAVINGQSNVNITYTNDSTTKVRISLSEFLIEGTTFTTAKTLEQKDNRLFFGNVKNDLISYLDTYESRAFRFKSGTNQIRVKQFEDDLVYKEYNVGVDGYPIETDDNIPLYNLALSTVDDPLYDSDYKYIQNNTVIGGSGPNLTYSFGNLLLLADNRPNYPVQLGLSATNQGTDSDAPGSAELYSHGYRVPGFMTPGNSVDPFFNGVPGQQYNINVVKPTMALEYLNGTYKTGQHNEIYRYGIQFYSKTGDSNFVKYIADIKFPNYSDPADPFHLAKTNAGNTCPDHRSMFYEAGNNKAYINIPYITFLINIPDALSKLIDGFEIVVVDRRDSDKTIISQGLVNQVATGHGSESNNFFLPISHGISTSGYNAMDPPTYGFSPAIVAAGYPFILSYHSFESLADKISGFSINDKIVLTEKYNYASLSKAIQPGGTPGSGSSFEEYYYINKYYDFSSFILGNNGFANNKIFYTVKDSVYVDSAATTNSINGLGVYHNYDYYDDGSPSYTNQAFANGSPTVVLGLDLTNPFIWETYSSAGNNTVNGNSKLLAIQHRFSRLRTQYGGRKYINRTTNEYISCGAFYPITGGAGVALLKVFGGDIYHGVLDTQKAIKNWTGVGSPTAANKHSQTWYFPSQSTYNIDLRRGDHVNKSLNNDGGSEASGVDEYFYTISYSYKNTIRKFIPKPAFFNQTSGWNNRVYWSNVKINGETNDSWSTTPVNNYYDVDGTYGGINALVILKNNMYFLQDRAFGILLINPYEIVTSQNNQSVGLGLGSTVTRHNYYSIDIGTKHQWSIFRSSENITFCDIRHKKLYLFNGQNLECISDTKGNRNFLNKVLHDTIITIDNPIQLNGILTTYDFVNNEFIYTFLNSATSRMQDYFEDKYTIAYSELTQSFTSFYSFTPYIYINNHSKLFSLDKYNIGMPITKIYQHNIGNYGNFYGNIYPSTIKVLINDNPKLTKVFDNLNWISESIQINREYIDQINDYISDSDDINQLNNTFSRVRCYNEYQNTDWTNLVTTGTNKNLRKLEQEYTLQIPRNKVNFDSNAINTASIFDLAILTKTTFKDRLRDKYLTVDLEYNNIFGNRFIIHNLGSSYRTSDR